MHDVMLFGEGWNGEVRPVEPGQQNFPYIPARNDPHLREVNFTIDQYVSENGEVYLIGFTQHKPMMPDVEHAIFRNNPKPI